MGNKMEDCLKRQKKIINFIMKIFLIFIIGSVFGFVAEIVYAFIYTRDLEIRRGLIYGPFIQIYGIGALAYYLLISKIKEPKKAFFIGMFMGGCMEYLFSFFQELLFGTISWDYTSEFLNVNGRTCFLYCLYWGIIAVLFLKIIYPLCMKLDIILEYKQIKVLTVCLMLFMFFDITISCMAAVRQQERRNCVPANSKVDEFLDKHYTDTFLDSVYNNKKEV